MAQKYNYYPIKIIKDWQGEDWEVYEEKKTAVGIMVYKGWLYSSGGKPFAYILTDEIAQYIKQNSIGQSVEQLGISRNKIICFRRELDVQKKYFTLDHQWMSEHQEELLNDSFVSLNQKYDLTRLQVKRYANYLKHTLSVVSQDNMRESVTSHQKEQRYQLHKDQIAKMTLSEIEENLNVSRATAYWMYRRVCTEYQLPTIADQRKESQAAYQQWLMANQQEIFRSDIEVKQIAKNLKLTKPQLMHARRRLNEIFPELGKKKDVHVWVKKHKDELLSDSRQELAKKYHLSLDQINYRRKLLKQQ
ncbi:hypothetical protein [Acinetobacter dispersus]|uniref:Uncharacterized protein n=1 Tax=Acinetobacter dispersus TaxID=70348 RepID=N9MQP4_9GAMM|nr:hypothetical protein [Acinetobacter dispersus]ENW93051.1 hypothetical protein F904_02994 [Acinetobacter dispersus]